MLRVNKVALLKKKKKNSLSSPKFFAAKRLICNPIYIGSEEKRTTTRTCSQSHRISLKKNKQKVRSQVMLESNALR